MNYTKIKEKFIQLYQYEPIVVKAPGRINLIGEHTDYNNGFVLPAAIDKNIYLAINKNNLERVRIYAFNLNESIDISIHNIKKNNLSWANYLLGSYMELINENHSLEGFDCVFGGNLPIGAGLSSSAAIECGIIYGLNYLYNLNINHTTIAKLAQRAEHNFVGVKCGIMDQYAIMFGKNNQVIWLDCQSLDYEYSPVYLEDYSIVLVNSNVKHSLASSEYNTRRMECETGVKILQRRFPEINSLRDSTIDQLYSLKDEFETTIFERCEYVILENHRVIEFSEALKNNDLNEIGDLLYETHLGLKNQYEVSCPELDLLAKSAKDMEFVLGSRMMGGGFGGCTINIVEKIKAKQFEQEITKIYTKKIGIAPDIYTVNITNGVELINE